MALTATLYSFEIEFSHVDRGLYETLAFRAAQHPSESVDYLLTRVLAYCLEYAPGIEFSKGLSTPDEPAVCVRDPTGTITTWIEIGNPTADRLHKATKAAARVVVYTHKDADRLVRDLSGARIHRRDVLEIYAVDRALLTAWTQRLSRRMTMTMSISDGQVYLGIGDETVAGTVEAVANP